MNVLIVYTNATCTVIIPDDDIMLAKVAELSKLKGSTDSKLVEVLPSDWSFTNPEVSQIVEIFYCETVTKSYKNVLNYESLNRSFQLFMMVEDRIL